jgi:CheY-like chemotaxis protein
MSRILLVDDNAAAVHAAAVLLTQWGHDVQIATDGPSAIMAARKWRPEFVLVDIGLPGMDGFQVAAALRDEPALGCRVIAVSALYREGDGARLAAAGVDHLLRKPLDVLFLRSLLGPPEPLPVPARRADGEIGKAGADHEPEQNHAG